MVEGAAVLGRDFRLEAIAELLPAKARAPLRRNLDALVAKGLVQPRPAGPGGAEVFRFRHVLVQQAAYRAIPKSRRAELHQLVAGLRSGPGAQDEIVGYHLERAYRYRAELGRVGEPERVLAAEAAERLGRAARAALVRGDLPGGASLLERAVSLLPDGSRTRAALLPGLGVALVEAGRLADADRVLVEAIGHAEAGGDHRLAARALVEHHLVRLHAGPGGELEDARAVADAALQVLKTHGTTSTSAGPGACRPGSPGPGAWPPAPTRPGGGPPSTPAAPATSGSCSRSSAGGPRRPPSGPPRCPRRSGSATASAARCAATRWRPR